MSVADVFGMTDVNFQENPSNGMRNILERVRTYVGTQLRFYRGTLFRKLFRNNRSHSPTPLCVFLTPHV